VRHNRTAFDDFWIIYFTSSKPIKDLIGQYGKESFSYNILLEDNSYDICYWYEQDLIKENIGNNLCLNIHYVDSSTNCIKFSTAGNKDVGKKISSYRKKTPLTEKQLANLTNMSKSRIGKTYEEISSKDVAIIRRKTASINRKKQLTSNPINGSKNPNAKTYFLTDPTGNIFKVTGNLEMFCKEHKLCVGLVIATAKGRREHYKNWKITYDKDL
jgi:hypothetical protein